MDPTSWQKVKSLLERALELPTDERSAFVSEKCRSDPWLRSEVEDLLKFHNEEDDLLDSSAYSTVAEGNDPLIGTQIGRYRIVGEIGSGGMGKVFLAERSDGEFEQKAAVKIMRSGIISDMMLRRFRTERQILAALEHPNIAHLIDGGATADGRPFLVMEYIEGSSITDYVNNFAVPLAQRLKLFQSICSAVSFAHQKLIIHRDLKPSNILVTNDGAVKLLDFGIAKLLTVDGSLETQTQAFAFTPDYASPEQIRGEPLSTATDIYSLGVLLFELLTGSRPHRFEGKSIAEIIQTVTEQNPPAPSATRALIGTVQGVHSDLDNIALMALRREPERRYRTVEQLSDDISRYLKGLPVSAAKDTWKYRASKFAGRHRLGIAASGLILITLIAGLAATMYQARIASVERAKAERRFNDVRQLANSLMFDINDQIVSSPIKAREVLVERAVEYLDKLADESEGDLELESELATAYEKIGDIQAEVFKPSSGKTSEALTSHQKGLALRKKAYEIAPTQSRATSLAAGQMKVGDILVASGRLAEAKEIYSAANAILASQADVANLDLRNQKARILARLGQVSVRSGALGDALRDYGESIDTYKDLVIADPSSVKYKRNLGIITSYRGFVMLEQGTPDAAVRDYGAMLEIERANAALDPKNTESRRLLSGALVWYGVALSEAGQIDSATTHFTQGIKLLESILAEDPGNLGEEYGLADGRLELGKALVRNSRFSDAIQYLEAALAGYRKVWQQDQQNLMARHRIANAQRFLGDAQFQTNQKIKALDNYNEAHIVFSELTASDPANVDWQQDLAMTFRRLGEFARDQRDISVARLNFESALPIFEKLASLSPENSKRRNELVEIRTIIEKL